MGRKKQNTEEDIQTLNVAEESNGDAQVLSDDDYRITTIGNSINSPAYALVWDSKDLPTHAMEDLIWAGEDGTKRWLYKTGWTGSIEIHLDNSGVGPTYDIGETLHADLIYGYITSKFFTHNFTTNAPQTITIDGSNYDLYKQGVMYVGYPRLYDGIGTFDTYVEVSTQEVDWGWVDLTDSSGGYDNWQDIIDKFGYDNVSRHDTPSELSMYIFPLYTLSTTVTQEIHLNHNSVHGINTIIREIPVSSQSPNEDYSNLAKWLGSPTGSECDVQQTEICIKGPGLNNPMALVSNGYLTFEYDELETVDIYVYNDGTTVLPDPVTTDGYPIIFQGVALTNSQDDVNECFYLSRENMDNGGYFSLDYKQYSDFFEKGELLLSLIYTEMYPAYSAPPVIASSVENGVISGASEGNFSWKLNYGVDYGETEKEISGEDELIIDFHECEVVNEEITEYEEYGFIAKTFPVIPGGKLHVEFVHKDDTYNATVILKDNSNGSESSMYIVPCVREVIQESVYGKYYYGQLSTLNGEQYFIEMTGEGDGIQSTSNDFSKNVHMNDFTISKNISQVEIGYYFYANLQGVGSSCKMYNNNSESYNMTYTSYTE